MDVTGGCSLLYTIQRITFEKTMFLSNPFYKIPEVYSAQRW